MEGTVKQITEYTSRSALLGGAVKDGEAEKVALKASRDVASEGVRESERTMVTLSSEYDSVCAQLRDVGDDKRRSKQEERMSEAVENMQRILSGVHGRLGDLCRPIQKKYAQVRFLLPLPPFFPLSFCPFALLSSFFLISFASFLNFFPSFFIPPLPQLPICLLLSTLT